MRISSIILARGGSKGIPKKNLIDFCGKPLLAWTILQSLATDEVTDVWVSSDNHEILDCAEQHGAMPIVGRSRYRGEKPNHDFTLFKYVIKSGLIKRSV